MFRIRYYDRALHPDEFRKGFLGWLIRTLNFIRWKLEVLVQWMVLRYLCKEESLPKAEESKLRKLFSLDVEQERMERLTSSPLVPQVEHSALRADRYQQGANVSIFESAKALDDVSKKPEPRPQPLDALAARYGHNMRAKKYARGPTKRMVSEDFEPIDSGG